jgi:ABC-type transport system substrate-binding protein
MRPSKYPLFAAVSLLLVVTSAESARRPRFGGALRLEMRAVVRSLDPLAPTDPVEAAASERILSLVFDRLVGLDESGRIKPSLAASWESDSAKRRWLVRLRPNVKFHNGAPLSPESVASALSTQNDSWTASAVPEGIVLYDLLHPRYFIFQRAGDGLPSGTGPFRIAQWEPGRRALFSANEDHWEGRPFLNTIAVEMGRGIQDQLLDLELNRADLIEIWPQEVRRAVQRGARIWSSAPSELMALVFERGGLAGDEARLREALALSIDRIAIHNVLLQKQGEPAGGLLPQWLSGYAFLFPISHDPVRARQQLSSLSPAAGPLRLAYDAADPLAKILADRIAVNARDAGITLLVGGQAGSIPSAKADLRVARARVRAAQPDKGLARLAALLQVSDYLSVPQPITPEAMYAAERGLIEDFRVIPLVHLPEVYGSNPKLKAWATTGLSKFGGWHFEDLWLDPEKP